MHKVELELPETEVSGYKDGDYFFDPVTDWVYRLCWLDSGRWVCYALRNNGPWRSDQPSPRDATDGLQKCPPGTVIIITVGGNDA